MILLITPSSRRQECADAIEAATGQPAKAVSSLQEASTSLRSRQYSAVVIDQCSLDADPDQAHLLAKQIETATSVYVNCAISSTERIVSEVRCALERRDREQASARRAALLQLRSELGQPLTGILLNCELVLESANLPPQVANKIREVDALARELAAKLETQADLSVKCR
jgi:hypothetical protein